MAKNLVILLLYCLLVVIFYLDYQRFHFTKRTYSKNMINLLYISVFFIMNISIDYIFGFDKGFLYSLFDAFKHIVFIVIPIILIKLYVKYKHS